MKSKLSKLIGIVIFIVVVICIMQISVPEIKNTIIAVHSSQGQFNQTNNAIVDSTVFYRMNWKSHYAQCINNDCVTKVTIRHPIAIHLIFYGRMYYEYDLMVYDNKNKGVYGCATVPAWVALTKRNWKWRIIGFHEMM